MSCFSRFEGVGIYVVMFWEIMKTLVRIVMLFLYLMLAFSLAFYALMLNQVGGERNEYSKTKCMKPCKWDPKGSSVLHKLQRQNAQHTDDFFC